MMHLRIDRWRMDESSVVVDPDTGWVTMEGTAALVGVMDYDDQSEYVPAETLADFESLLAAPLTVGHPPKNLDIESTRKYQTGTVLSAKFVDSKKLRVRIRATDASAIAAVQSGTVELSPGYIAELDKTPGVFAGKKYDAIQVKRRYNHLALVDRARGGRQAKLDSWRADGALIQRTDMETVTIEGKEYQVPPEVAAIVTSWQAEQESAADAEEPAADADGAPAPAATTTPAAPAAKTPSSITVKMDSAALANLKREIVADLTAAIRHDKALDRKAAAELGETIALVRPLLPKSYHTDGKDVGTLIADALVTKKPDLAGWVKKHRTDGSMLRGALEMLLTGEKPIDATESERADSNDDEISKAQAEQERRMKTRTPLAAVEGGKK
jgi:hypothetical protein